MAKYKVASPLYVTSQKKLYEPVDIVDLTGTDEEAALHFHAVVPVAQQAAKPVTMIASTPAKTGESK